VDTSHGRVLTTVAQSVNFLSPQTFGDREHGSFGDSHGRDRELQKPRGLDDTLQFDASFKGHGTLRRSAQTYRTVDFSGGRCEDDSRGH
jgi:hypothetical protein